MQLFPIRARADEGRQIFKSTIVALVTSLVCLPLYDIFLMATTSLLLTSRACWTTQTQSALSTFQFCFRNRTRDLQACPHRHASTETVLMRSQFLLCNYTRGWSNLCVRKVMARAQERYAAVVTGSWHCAALDFDGKEWNRFSIGDCVRMCEQPVCPLWQTAGETTS